MDRRIALVGEVAESYVRLQWVEFWVCTFLVTAFAGFIAWAIWRMLKDH